MSRDDLKYSFNNADSLRIFPKINREPISGIALSNPKRVIRRALNASEKEYKGMIIIANRRMDKINNLIQDKIDLIKKSEEDIFSVVSESIKSGEHLVDELFIPEYLGFEEIVTEGEDEIRLYAKEGYTTTRLDDKWIICSPDETKTVIKITNMRDAIVILSGLGVDVSFLDYVSGEYTPAVKSIEESVDEIVDKILKDRKKGKK